MKGQHLVIGIILFVLIVVGLIYFLMMDTINDIKEEMDTGSPAIEIVQTNTE